MTKFSYQRVSTNLERQSLLRQEKYARDNGVPECNWYQECASGAKKDRPKLQQLMFNMKENDELYLIDASRLTRSLSQLLSILDYCKERKIKLVMGDFTLDCRGNLSVLTQGQIMMLGMINEINRLMIIESVREGLESAKEENRIGGQPKITKERIYSKNPDFAKYYIEYKKGNINKKELSRLCCVCRNTITNWLHVIED